MHVVVPFVPHYISDAKELENQAILKELEDEEEISQKLIKSLKNKLRDEKQRLTELQKSSRVGKSFRRETEKKMKIRVEKNFRQVNRIIATNIAELANEDDPEECQCYLRTPATDGTRRRCHRPFFRKIHGHRYCHQCWKENYSD